jgi:hypothetical protein
MASCKILLFDSGKLVSFLSISNSNLRKALKREDKGYLECSDKTISFQIISAVGRKTLV